MPTVVTDDQLGDATGENCSTATPAGDQINGIQVGPYSAANTGVMYVGKGKRVCPFEFRVLPDPDSPSGYVIHFVLRDKRTGLPLVNRTDALDAGSTIYFKP